MGGEGADRQARRRSRAAPGGPERRGGKRGTRVAARRGGPKGKRRPPHSGSETTNDAIGPAQPWPDHRTGTDAGPASGSADMGGAQTTRRSTALSKTHPCDDRPARRRARGPGGQPSPCPPGIARVQRGGSNVRTLSASIEAAVCAQLNPRSARRVSAACHADRHRHGQDPSGAWSERSGDRAAVPQGGAKLPCQTCFLKPFRLYFNQVDSR